MPVSRWGVRGLVAATGVVAVVVASGSAAMGSGPTVPLGAPIVSSIARVSATAVRVNWLDNSSSETSFTVKRAPLNEYQRTVDSWVDLLQPWRKD